LLLDESSRTEHIYKYEQLLAQEMPALLGNMLEDEFREHNNVTKERVHSIVKKAQTKLFYQFRSASSANPSASSPAAVADASTDSPQRRQPFDLEESIPIPI
jgi:hypothetical protein